MAQNLVTLDLEGVLVPEVWIAFAEKTGIEGLKKTTRDNVLAGTTTTHPKTRLDLSMRQSSARFRRARLSMAVPTHKEPTTCSAIAATALLRSGAAPMT